MNVAPDPKSIPQGTLLSPEANQAAALAAATGVLTVDLDAIVANWRKLEKTAVPAECAAVVKADGYGCGAEQVARALAGAGCKTFFVATLDEARVVRAAAPAAAIYVLGGFFQNTGNAYAKFDCKPVIGDLNELAEWDVFCRRSGWSGGAAIHIDTGMNRLGLRTDEIAHLDGLDIHTLHSHLACADEDSAMNQVQLDRFAAVAATVAAKRYALANSAGICLGRDYSFDLVRPGLALYGGVPRDEAIGHIAQVAFPEAEIVQRRKIRPGETCGYGATWTAQADTEAAIVNIGYADGYLRCFAGKGAASANGKVLPLIGRVSMDLIALDVSAAPDLAEGDWVTLDYALPSAAEATGLSQYELLTGLSDRLERRWV
jgi:alanine racemase